MASKTKYEICIACGFWKEGCLAEMIGQTCTVEAAKARVLMAVKKHRNVYKLIGNPKAAQA